VVRAPSGGGDRVVSGGIDSEVAEVATPFTAVAVAVLLPVENVPPVSVSVTADASMLTALPAASSTATTTPVTGLIA